MMLLAIVYLLSSIVLVAFFGLCGLYSGTVMYAFLRAYALMLLGFWFGCRVFVDEPEFLVSYPAIIGFLMGLLILSASYYGFKRILKVR